MDMYKGRIFAKIESKRAIKNMQKFHNIYQNGNSFLVYDFVNVRCGAETNTIFRYVGTLLYLFG